MVADAAGTAASIISWIAYGTRRLCLSVAAPCFSQRLRYVVGEIAMDDAVYVVVEVDSAGINTLCSSRAR